MGNIVVAATMSLDGYIAHHDNSVDPLFDWYSAGERASAEGDPERVFSVTAASADWMQRYWSRVGACIIGRATFDVTDGWGGRPAAGDHVFVVTHEPPAGWTKRFPEAPFTFVPEGVAAAVEQAGALAGDRDVTVTAGSLAGQALGLGLVDEVDIALAPVVFGSGKRFFGDYDAVPYVLEDPYDVVTSARVTHLRYRARACVPVS